MSFPFLVLFLPQFVVLFEPFHHLFDSHSLAHPAQFLVPFLELPCVLVRQNEIKRQLVFVEVVDKVPKQQFIVFSERGYIYFKFFRIKEHLFQPLMQLLSTVEHSVLFLVGTGNMVQFLANCHFQQRCLDLTPTVSTQRIHYLPTFI